MSNTVLSQLLRNVADLSEVTRLRVLQEASAGHATQALDTLTVASLSVNRSTPAWGVLQMYLLHLAGRYAEANRVLDNMIGLNLSEQLTINNCPAEGEIMARWDSAAEGVSILCTTFNHARFIDMALASFFSQVSTHPFEVIVRDDASTDGTSALLGKWEQRYPRLLKVIRLEENTYQLGQSPMLATIHHATKPLVAMCEGDDFWIDSRKLHLQGELLQYNSTWSAITHNHFILDESLGELIPRRDTKISGLLDKADLVSCNVILQGNTLMIRRGLVDIPKYSLKDGVLGDQVFTSILGLAGPVYVMGDFFGSVYRRNLVSSWTPLDDQQKILKMINTRRFLAPILIELGERRAALRMLRFCEIAERQVNLQTR